VRLRDVSSDRSGTATAVRMHSATLSSYALIISSLNIYLLSSKGVLAGNIANGQDSAVDIYQSCVSRATFQPERHENGELRDLFEC
jgi:hypothetical protein